MNKFITFMEKYFVSFAQKVADNRVLKMISEGSMSLLGIIMVGSLFTVVLNISWGPYQEFLASNPIGTLIAYIPSFTIDLLALYMAFSIAYNGARIWGIEKHSLNTGLISLVSFLLLTPQNSEALEGVKFLDVSFLGPKGVFVAIIVAVLSTLIMRFFVNKNITIRMPEGVPAMVTNSFISLIPAAVIVLFFGSVKLGFASTDFNTATEFIYTMLQNPLQSLTGSLPAFLILIVVAQILWFFGVHGSLTVLPILFPIFLGYLAENTAAVSAGGVAPNAINFGLYDLACLGGAGATIGLVLVMALFSKSKRYKAFSKIVVPCGLFGVNEPVIFGMPLMLNVMMFIPFILTPLILVSLAYFLISIGLITPTLGVLGAGSLPPFIHGLAQGSLSFGIFEIFATGISMLIYYPFFKVLDNQAYAEEMSKENEEVSLYA